MLELFLRSLAEQKKLLIKSGKRGKLPMVYISIFLSFSKYQFIFSGKQYQNSTEDLERFAVFLSNKKAIEEHNFEQQDFKKSLNKFSDLRPEEFRKMMLMTLIPNETFQGNFFISPPSEVKLPDNFSWRTKGAVTPVKDQGPCGSCWAFSTTGTLEGFHFRKTGKLVSLSEQNLLDCDSNEYGCNGGYPGNALEYVHQNHGIDTEISYPYEGLDHMKCR